MINSKRPFAVNLKRARMERKWSQETAAMHLQIKRCTLGAYEEGRAEPPLITLARICAVYKVKDPIAFIENSAYFVAVC